MEIFFEIHCGLPREGPGNEASTRRALELIPDLPSRPRILDVGCGPGNESLFLARETGGTVVAVDTHQPYLDQLTSTARDSGLADRIETVNRSMTELAFEPESFDLIWSEGAIYIMGFGEGLAAWRPFLRPGGALAVTHIAWLQETPTAEAKAFWDAAYPAIRHVDENRRVVREAGYEEVAHFALPPEAWWTDYYGPMERRIEELTEKYAGDAEALEVLEGERAEIELYRRYSEAYGYVFFVMRRR